VIDESCGAWLLAVIGGPAGRRKWPVRISGA